MSSNRAVGRGQEQLTSRGCEPAVEWLLREREPVEVQRGAIPLTQQDIGVGEGAMEPVRAA